eukprot:3137285-Lingulodinium_polyedra.AAC.1
MASRRRSVAANCEAEGDRDPPPARRPPWPCCAAPPPPPPRRRAIPRARAGGEARSGRHGAAQMLAPR